MASEDTRYSDNDTGPFAGPTHELVYGGPGPQEVDIDMRDRDVMLNVRVDGRTIRLLHLQNVREDTVVAARNAVDSFLDQLKAIDDREGAHPERSGHTMLEDFTQVHLDLRDYIEARAEELGFRFDWERGGFPRESFRHACSQPKYLVRFCQDGSTEQITGTRGVPYPKPRGPTQGGESSGNKVA
jgi:hypothetical protein